MLILKWWFYSFTLTKIFNRNWLIDEILNFWNIIKYVFVTGLNLKPWVGNSPLPFINWNKSKYRKYVPEFNMNLSTSLDLQGLHSATFPYTWHFIIQLQIGGKKKLLEKKKLSSSFGSLTVLSFGKATSLTGEVSRWWSASSSSLPSVKDDPTDSSLPSSSALH